MKKKISLRNLYITRLIATGVTQKSTAELFDMSPCRAGVIAYDVAKRLVPIPSISRFKYQPLRIYMTKHLFTLLKSMLDYERDHYPDTFKTLRNSTEKEAVQLIKGLKP